MALILFSEARQEAETSMQKLQERGGLDFSDTNSDESKRVLFLTTDFPPLAGTNTQRVFRLVSALSWFGWEPEVVTLAIADMPEISSRDLEGLPEAVGVTRIPSPDPFRRLARARGRVPPDRSRSVTPGTMMDGSAPYRRAGSGSARVREWARAPLDWASRSLLWYLKHASYMPDGHAPWAKAAAREVVGRPQASRPHVLITSCPSFSSHVAGLRIKRKTNLPWIADFRDLWTDRPYRKGNSVFHPPIERRLERMVFERADHVILASPGWVEHFRQKYGSLVEDKLTALPAGFVTRERSRAHELRTSGKLRFVYTGAMFGAETPAPFLTALGNVLFRKPQYRERVEVRFFGYGGPETPRLLALVRQYGLESLVTFSDPIPHDGCLAEQAGADVLLLFLGPLHRQTVCGKTFEYLSTGKPILAMIPLGGAQAAILEEAGTALMVAHGDVSGAERAIENMLDGASRAWLSPDWTYINSFEQRQIAGRLADIMERLA